MKGVMCKDVRGRRNAKVVKNAKRKCSRQELQQVKQTAIESSHVLAPLGRSSFSITIVVNIPLSSNFLLQLLFHYLLQSHTIYRHFYLCFKSLNRPRCLEASHAPPEIAFDVHSCSEAALHCKTTAF